MGRHGENIRKRKDGRWEARVISSHTPDGKAIYRSVSVSYTHLDVYKRQPQPLLMMCFAVWTIKNTK